MLELESEDGFYKTCTECDKVSRVVGFTSEDWGCGAYLCKECLTAGLKLLEDIEE